MVPCAMSDDREHKRDYLARDMRVRVPSGLHDRPDVYYAMQKVADETVSLLGPRSLEMKKHGLAVTHFQHGIFVFGTSLGEAFDNLERVEVNAKVQLLAAAAGLHSL